MNLVLVGRADLDSLQSYAETNFSEVENRELPIKDFSGHVVFDEKHTFGRICKIIPSKDIKTLTLEW